MKLNAYLFILIILVSACRIQNNDPLKPNVSGKSGEIVVVIPTHLWEGEPGKALQEHLGKEFLVLPQPEPSFDLIPIPPNAFSNTFKLARNIIIVNTSSDKKKLTEQYDTWANSQLIVALSAPNAKELTELINSKGDDINSIIDSKEKNRILRSYKANQKVAISQQLRKNHDLSLVVPLNYAIDVDTNNFVWISKEDPLFTQGIFIYYYPYTSENTFTPEYLIEMRDRVLKQNVPGPVRGSYMVTERDFVIDFAEYMFKDDQYVAIIHGLWKVENAFMGGPFVSMTTLDEERNRVVTVEGFVYAPQQDKRNYIRQMEAIIYSLKMVPEKKEKNK